MSRLHTLADVEPVHLIGESHCLAFGNRLFRDDDSGLYLHCRASFLPGLSASQFVAAGSGPLHPELVAVMQAERLINKQGVAMHLACDPLAVSVSLVSGRPQGAPVVVLFAGDTDLHPLMQQLGEGHDFELVGDCQYGMLPGRQTMPAALLRAQLAQLFNPLLVGIDRLRAAGFSRLMLHCLPPRTVHDQHAARWLNGVRVPAPVRAKLTRLANDVLGEACARRGIGFVDTWDALTRDGYLAPEYELDGVHVSASALPASIDGIVRLLGQHRDGTHNAQRYRLLAERARSDPGAAAVESASTGFGVIALGTDAAARLAGRLVFPEVSQPSPLRLDWVGPAASRDGVDIAVSDPVLLRSLAETVGQPVIQAALATLAGNAMSVVSFRGLRVASSNGAVPAAVMQTPPSCRRGLLALGASLRLEFYRALPQSPVLLCSRIAAAGDLVIYDPAEVCCLIAGPVDNALLIECCLMPRLPGQVFRVIDAGSNEWPVDPFCYSLAGMLSEPPGAEIKESALPLADAVISQSAAAR